MDARADSDEGDRAGRAARLGVVTAADVVARHVRLDISCLDRVYLNVILSFHVTRGCDLRRLAEDGVFDETDAA